MPMVSTLAVVPALLVLAALLAARTKVVANPVAIRVDIGAPTGATALAASALSAIITNAVPVRVDISASGTTLPVAAQTGPGALIIADTIVICIRVSGTLAGPSVSVLSEVADTIVVIVRVVCASVHDSRRTFCGGRGRGILLFRGHRSEEECARERQAEQYKGGYNQSGVRSHFCITFLLVHIVCRRRTSSAVLSAVPVSIAAMSRPVPMLFVGIVVVADAVAVRVDEVVADTVPVRIRSAAPVTHAVAVPVLELEALGTPAIARVGRAQVADPVSVFIDEVVTDAVPVRVLAIAQVAEAVAVRITELVPARAEPAPYMRLPVVTDTVAIYVDEVLAYPVAVGSAPAQITDTVAIAVLEHVSVRVPAEPAVRLPVITDPVVVLVDEVVADAVAVFVNSLPTGVTDAVAVVIDIGVGGFGYLREIARTTGKQEKSTCHQDHRQERVLRFHSGIPFCSAFPFALCTRSANLPVFRDLHPEGASGVPWLSGSFWPHKSAMVARSVLQLCKSCRALLGAFTQCRLPPHYV